MSKPTFFGNPLAHMTDDQLRQRIDEIDALPEDECHPNWLIERDEAIYLLRDREAA